MMISFVLTLTAATCLFMVPIAVQAQCDRVFLHDEIKEVHYPGHIRRYDSVVTDSHGTKYVYKSGAWRYKDGGEQDYYDSSAVVVSISMLPNGDVYYGRYGDSGNIYVQYKLCSEPGESWQVSSSGGRMRNLGTDGILFDGKRWMGQRFEEYDPSVPEDWHRNVHTMIDSFGLVGIETPANGQVHLSLLGVVIGNRVYGKVPTSVSEHSVSTFCGVEMTFAGTLRNESEVYVRSVRVVTPLGQVLDTFLSIPDFNRAVDDGRYSRHPYTYVVVDAAGCAQTMVLLGGL